MSTHHLRKLGSSLGERGLVGTARYAVQSLGWRVRGFLDGSFDRRFGTETSGFVAVSDLDFESPSAREAIWYEPVPARVLRSILRTINIPCWPTFIDYGSGKGRALLVAAEFPHQRIIGVELSKQLSIAATRNIEVYRNPDQRCRAIMSLHMDGGAFVPPPGPTLHFFYSPFKGEVMRTVLRRLRTAMASDPSPRLIVFYGRNRSTIEAMDELGWHRRELPIRRAWSAETKYRAFLYQSGEALAPAEAAAATAAGMDADFAAPPEALAKG